MLSVFGIVTLYKPTSDVVENIRSYAPWLKALLVWDNTPEKERLRMDWQALFPEVRVTVRTGANTGIGQALSEARRQALADGFSHLLLMDQDSVFAPGVFDRYLYLVEQESAEGLVLFSPTRFESCYVEGSSRVLPVDEVIISGTLIPAGTLRKAGDFRVTFKMDAIDNEYSLRIRRLGGRMYRLEGIFFRHQLGYTIHRRFLGIPMSSHNYSPMRTYFITRNFLLLKRSYPEYNMRYILKLFYLRRPLAILCIERDKWAKLKAFFRGLWDGLRGKELHDGYLA